MPQEISEHARLEDGHKLGDKAVVGAGATIYGFVYGTVGERTTVYRGATVRGTVGKGCTVGVSTNIDERADVGDKVWIGETANLKQGAKVGDDTVIPAHATITSDMEVVRRGDVVVVGMVGSEGNGRYVTIGRQPDNRARLVVGCWLNHRGGSVDELDARVEKKTWNKSGLYGQVSDDVDPLEALFHAQYLGIIQLARSLEQIWATYTTTEVAA